MARSLALALVTLLPLSSCSIVESTADFLGSDILPLRMTQIESTLAPFSAERDYDYLAFSEQAGEDAIAYADSPTIRYHRTGLQSYDDIFYRSALLAGQFHQFSETLTRYRAGDLSLDDDRDTRYISAMVAGALQTLPGIVDDAQTLMSRARSFNRQGLTPGQWTQVSAGVTQTVSNLNLILDRRDEVDDMLGDYERLQYELDSLE